MRFGATLPLIVCAAVLVSACGENSSDIQEAGQQLGDVMASIDEAGGSGGAFASMNTLESSRRTYARLAPGEMQESWIASLISPASAYALGCSSANTWGSCTNNVVTRTFDSCVIGTTRTTGSVTFTYDDGAVDNSCLLSAAGNTVTRVPNFTVTGRRGATLEVSKVGTHGQILKKESNSTYTFTNDGIRRVFKTSSGESLFDYTTVVNSPIEISGNMRSNRVITGGTLRVTDNLTNVTCDYTPDQVSWSAGCNCPTSGSWVGKCSDGRETQLNIKGCGNGNLKLGDKSETFTFDRCYEI